MPYSTIPSVTIESKRYTAEISDPQKKLLKIIKEPYDDETLRLKSVNVENFSQAYKFATQYLLPTMYHANGMGIAAVQVGIPIKLFVVDVPTKTQDEQGNPVDIRTPEIYINAQIIESSEEKIILPEGCLSVPERFITTNFKIDDHKQCCVQRPISIKVRYQDQQGQWREKYLDGTVDARSQWDARCWQHEYDHTEGILFIDKLYQDS